MSEPHSIPADNEKAWEESDNKVLKDNWEKIAEASVNDFGEPVPAVMSVIVDNFAPKEDHYEGLELIVKSRQDGVSWFDIISDLITQDCEGGGGDCIVEDGDESDCDDHDHEELLPCTCGLESMGGSGGTLEQCYAWKTNLGGGGIQPIDVARVIDFLASPNTAPYVAPADRVRIIEWARREIEFEEYFESEEGDEQV